MRLRHAPPPRRRQQPRGPERASPRALSNPTGKLTIALYRSIAGAAGIVSGIGLLLLGLQVCAAPRPAPPLATPRAAAALMHDSSAAVDHFGRQPDFALLWPARHFLPARAGFAYGKRVHGVGSDATDRRRLCVPLHAPHVAAVPGRARVPCCTAVSIERHALTGPIALLALTGPMALRGVAGMSRRAVIRRTLGDGPWRVLFFVPMSARRYLIDKIR